MILARTIVYATLFISSLLVFLPGRILARSGVTPPASFGAVGWAGAALTCVGGALAVWCIGTFVVLGKGTPAPFDPPRRLVIRGPYRFVRNPMYVGAFLALAGVAVVYRSLAVFGYATGLLLALHAFVVTYEEPTLRRSFGQAYERYCRETARWWPFSRPRLPG